MYFVNKNCHGEFCFCSRGGTGGGAFDDMADYETEKKKFMDICRKEGRLLEPREDWRAPGGILIGDQIFFVDDDGNETRVFPIIDK